MYVCQLSYEEGLVNSQRERAYGYPNPALALPSQLFFWLLSHLVPTILLLQFFYSEAGCDMLDVQRQLKMAKHVNLTNTLSTPDLPTAHLYCITLNQHQTLHYVKLIEAAVRVLARCLITCKVALIDC